MAQKSGRNLFSSETLMVTSCRKKINENPPGSDVSAQFHLVPCLPAGRCGFLSVVLVFCYMFCSALFCVVLWLKGIFR
jgi:hypothetical protein